MKTATPESLMATSPKPEPFFSKKTVRFLLDYFRHSDKKWKAYLLLAGCVLGTLAAVGLGLAIGAWAFPFMYGAFVAKDVTLLLLGLGGSALLAVGIAACKYVVSTLRKKLYLKWRSWLTDNMLQRYLAENKFLDISRNHREINNLSQRIQESVGDVVESSLDLFLGFIENFSTLVVFLTLLALASVTATFLFPGYLVVIALGVGVAGSLIGYFVSKSLAKRTHEQIESEANLREGIQEVEQNAEAVALEATKEGDKYFSTRLKKLTDAVMKKNDKKLNAQNRIGVFQTIQGMIQELVPFLAAAPLYFLDLINIEMFWSIGYYFNQVTRALTWFTNSIELINKLKTSLARVVALQKTLDEKPRTDSARKIWHELNKDNEHIRVEGVDLELDNGQVVIKNINLEFKKGENVLIQGKSGTGKTTFLKAQAGTSISGEGVLYFPPGTRYFLPQAAMIPKGTLRNALIYPNATGEWTDEQFKEALKAVRLDKMLNQLDEPIQASGGELQRIAFARVFLRKPDWVFLDESTSALDEETQKELYERLKTLLPDTTIISVAHRPTVKPHHDRWLTFAVDEQKKAIITEEWNPPKRRASI